jgi:hypothetical protein
MAAPITTLSALKEIKFYTLQRIHPAGTLQARKDTLGVTTFYWRCTINNRDFRETIGVFDAKCPPLAQEPTSHGYSMRAAAVQASKLAGLHMQYLSIGGLLGLRQQQAIDKKLAEQAAMAAAQEAESLRFAAIQAEEARAVHNLAALLLAYAGYLQSLGRVSHSNARSIFNKHVIKAFPHIAAKPASDVTTEEVAQMMRHLIEEGKGRTANKLRSYIRAAYQVAKASRSKPSIPTTFQAFHVVVNPAADTSPDESSNRADKRPLALKDLQLYWSVLQKVEGIKGVSLRLHLLTGGQRVAQLCRLLAQDVADEFITIYDGKGRPGKPPRQHVVPLVDAAKKELAACAKNAPFMLSTNGGRTSIGSGNLGKWAVEALDGKIPNFQLKRVRSGVETVLASARIPREYRGRLQSHGISGVQAVHYDGYDYLDEKRESLEILFGLITQVQQPHTRVHERSRYPRVRQKSQRATPVR